MVLTDRGRKLLSTNQLEFVYYAFGDNEIDYSGSIDVVSKTTGTLDGYMIKNFTFEADQKKDNIKDRTLRSWLFTMPSDNSVVPEFKLSNTGSITLNRKYKVQHIEEKLPVKPIAVVTTLSIAVESPSLNHIHSQILSNFAEKDIEEKAVESNFLTEDVKNLVLSIKKAQTNTLLKAVVPSLKIKYKEATSGRDYDADLAAGLI